MGIIVCGLNGSGKSTLGRALAECLGWRFIDNEDLYFPKNDPAHPYADARSRDAVARLLLEAVSAEERFVFASVRGDYGEAVLPYYQAAVLVEVPREERLHRVRARSYGKFGERMLPGRDMYASEQAFFDMVSVRPEDYTRRWLDALNIPVLRVENTKPVEESVAQIMDWLNENHLRCQ